VRTPAAILLNGSLAKSLIVAFAVTSSQPLAAQKPATGSIGGTVITAEEGRPLQARVWLVAAARPHAPNARGSFIFEGLAPGRYHLRATYLGFIPVDTMLSVAPGARVQVVIRMTAQPVELTEMTIRDTAKPPPPPPKPTPPPPHCERFLVVSMRTMLCLTRQMLRNTVVHQDETFTGPHSLILEAAQEAEKDLGFVTERILQLNDRTWLIVAHDRLHPRDSGVVQLEVEQTGTIDTRIRVRLATVAWGRKEQLARAQVFLAAVRRRLR
jgi:hypothetical protein